MVRAYYYIGSHHPEGEKKKVKKAKFTQLCEYSKTGIDLIPVGEDEGTQSLVLFNLMFLYYAAAAVLIRMKCNAGS